MAIYLYVPEAERLFLLEVYDKDDADDLGADQRKALAELARAYREESLKKGKKR